MEIARVILLVCLMLASAGAAMGAERGFYFGAVGGQTDYDFESPLNLFVLQPSVTIPVTSPSPQLPIGGAVYPAFGSAVQPLAWPPGADSESGAWGAVAGYRISRYAAIELNYLNLGSLKRNSTLMLGFPTPTGSIEIRHELETRGPALAALGLYPVTERFDLYARAGVFFADVEASSSLVSSTVQVVGGRSSVTFGSEALAWGGGAQFHWGQHWSVRLEFQRFENVGERNTEGEADIDLLSLGVLFRL